MSFSRPRSKARALRLFPSHIRSDAVDRSAQERSLDVVNTERLCPDVAAILVMSLSRGILVSSSYIREERNDNLRCRLKKDVNSFLPSPTEGSQGTGRPSLN